MNEIVFNQVFNYLGVYLTSVFITWDKVKAQLPSLVSELHFIIYLRLSHDNSSLARLIAYLNFIFIALVYVMEILLIWHAVRNIGLEIEGSHLQFFGLFLLSTFILLLLNGWCRVCFGFHLKSEVVKNENPLVEIELVKLWYGQNFYQL